jgi:CBS domain containing-hemolysin-like protein
MGVIIVILLTILFSAFFSGMEIAFVSSNKLRIELDKKKGVFGSEIIKIFTNNPGQFIATMLVGNNVALVVYGLFFTRLFNPVFTPVLRSDALVLIINTIISTTIILIFSEFLPKTVSIISPNFFLKIFSIPTIFFYWIFYPVSKFTLGASNLVIRIVFKKKPGDKVKEDLVFSKVDLDHFVSLNTDIQEGMEPIHHNIRIFRNALDFSNVKLRECMIPRTEIEAIEAGSPVAELKEKFIETQHSRILVYRETIDNITGYFELKDIFKNPSDIISSVRKLAIVPETMAANKLLKIFVEEKKNVALVVDEFGGTSGMVTIEDIIEEIFGDIEDEHDVNEFTEKVVSDKEYIFSGRLEIDYLNEKYNLNLPEEDDYETLAGMILFYHGSIPANNDVIRIKNLVFSVLKVTATRIELVNMKVE